MVFSESAIKYSVQLLFVFSWSDTLLDISLSVHKRSHFSFLTIMSTDAYRKIITIITHQ